MTTAIEKFGLLIGIAAVSLGALGAATTIGAVDGWFGEDEAAQRWAIDPTTGAPNFYPEFAMSLFIILGGLAVPFAAREIARQQSVQ